MKLLPIAAVIAAFAFTPVAFAQTATPTPANKVDPQRVRFKLKAPWPDFFTFYSSATAPCPRAQSIHCQLRQLSLHLARRSRALPHLRHRSPPSER